MKRKFLDSAQFTKILRDPTNATRQLLTLWADIPILLMLDVDWERGPLVLIGTADYMMWPLLPPGTLLQLNPKLRSIGEGEWTEFDRPVYLIEHDARFYCCYAQQKRQSLLLIPHNESPSRNIVTIQWKDARVRGQVTPVFRPLATRGSAAGRLNQRHTRN